MKCFLERSSKKLSAVYRNTEIRSKRWSSEERSQIYNEFKNERKKRK